ncbi:hypothetical protein GHT06_010941 [Daphnia sinensis]|uniref:G-protein coupled receptors family 2 profile 2 domain-containing protein n=1 Tax=Daphnia sinensis TaxID=1820382 RepID=A0AAD5LT29_9CRUS|nr:hypothetical protein GHT06_010941 [Daphnia sinensis]
MILFNYFLVLLTLFKVQCNHAANVSLAKCCSDSPESNACNSTNSVHEWLQLPPVYSAITNQTVDSAQFSLRYHNATCTSGYKIKSSTQFHLHTNGSVNVQGKLLQSNEFCLEQNLRAEFTVRYCVPDACSQTHCVRKCCPRGTVLNVTSFECDPHNNATFEFVFHDTLGQLVNPDPGSYIIQDTDPLECPNNTGTQEPLTSKTRMFSVSPDENIDDLFYILPDGQLFFPNFPEGSQTFRDYCIDDFLSENAILFLPNFKENTQKQDTQLAIGMFPYFLFIFTVFLIATFLVYASIPELRNVHGVTVMCYVASLAVTYVGLGINQLRTEDSVECIIVAVIVHYAFLSTFSWLSVFSFDIWRTFRDLRLPSSRTGHNHLGTRFICYSIYAWSVPFVIVSVGQILDYHVDDLPSHIIRPQFDGTKCWFNDKAASWIYLYGPMALWILCNIAFFLMTAVILHRAKRDTAFAAKSVHAKQNLRLIFSLFILMGVTWIMEVASFAIGGSAYYWIPTDILNILTAVFIFYIFVCKPNVWNLLQLKFPWLKVLDRCRPSQETTRKTSQQTTRDKC